MIIVQRYVSCFIQLICSQIDTSKMKSKREMENAFGCGYADHRNLRVHRLVPVGKGSVSKLITA